MSKFLAPIHSWLFNKIKIHEDLEREIETSFKSKYGEEVTNIVNKSISAYGDRLQSDNLEDIIDESNIHGWLQQNITVVETRQAAILGDLFDKYGDDGLQLAHSIYKENGAKNGELAKEEVTIENPEDAYKALNNYILDGMPCDSAGSVTKSDKDVLEAVQNSCLHINYWKTAGVDPEKMYNLRNEWKAAFINAIEPNFEYSVNVDKISDDNRSFVYRVTRK